jgi:hypothetical protein
MSPPFSHESAELLQHSSINPAPHDPPLGSLSLSRTKDSLWSSQTRFAGALALTQSTNAHGWRTAWWTKTFDESSTWTLHFYASMWMRVSHTHMDEEQHGGRKSSTNHPHELYIFMRPCGWEYHKRTSMKKQHCGWQISTNNARGVNICMHPSGSQKHMDDEISLWMKYFDESSAWTLHLYASMRMWESQMHMDEEIVLWTK